MASAGPAERRLFLFVKKDSTDVLEELACGHELGFPTNGPLKTEAVRLWVPHHARDEIFVRQFEMDFVHGSGRDQLGLAT